MARDESAGRSHPGRPVGLGTPITRSPAVPEPTPEPPPGLTVSAAPMALAREIAAAAGVELDRVLVHRGPEIDRRAQDLGAAAYAVDDTVHVGSAAGPDDSVEARALVAHELTHVAQQRRLGSALPEEASAAGGELEAEALAVEQAVRYGAALPDLSHPRRAERSGAGPDPQGVVRADAGPRRSPVRGEGGPGLDPGRPMAAFGQAVGVPESGVAVRGRVQRRAAAPIHPHAPAPVSASASPQATPAAPAPTSSPSATPAATTAPAAAAAAAPAAQPTGWAGFETALGNDARSMVLEAWSLEEPGSSSSSAGGGTQQEQFNQIAGAALNRLNDERSARGEAPLSQLPHDEEMRIMAQIQGGTASTGGLGHGGHQPAPIRNWDDFGSAITNDLADEYGSFFGIEGSTLTGAAATDTAAATGTTPAAPATAAGTTASAPAAGTAATGTSATGTAAAAAHAEEPEEPDLELLTTQLYDRIRSRLRRELLLDRERAGLLSDFR